MVETGITLGPELLQTLQPIGSLGALRIEELMPRCCIERIPAGLTLFREGETDSQAVYLLHGEVVVSNAKNELNRVLVVPTPAGDMPAEQYPIAHKQPRQLSAVAVTDLDILRVDSELLDFLVAWDELAGYGAAARQQRHGKMPVAMHDWMSLVRRSLVFQPIPPSNLEALGARLEPVPVRAGQVVAREGENADDYYLIESGTATVTCETDGSGPAEITTLGCGAAFGDEGLRDGERWRSTVTMKTRGTLLRLARRHFLALRRERSLSWLKPSEASAMVESGAAVWLDVRRREEYIHSHLPESRLLPLRALHELVDGLSRDGKYICYCNSGRRSAAAAHLLSQRGLQAHALTGGLRAAPEDWVIDACG